MKNRNCRGMSQRAIMVVLVIVPVILLPLLMWGLITHFSKTPGTPLSEITTQSDVAQTTAPAALTSAPAVAAAQETTLTEKPADAGTPAAVAVAPAGGTTMDLLVVDQASKEPIAGSQVLTAGVPTKDRFKGTTGPDGHVQVPVPPKPNGNFNVGVHPKGYVYMRLYWNRGGVKEDIPATYTIEMEHAERVRGKVVDEQGNPIGGASVLLAVKKANTKPHEFLDVGGGAGLRTIKAAESGIFSYTGVPATVDSIEIGAWDYHHLIDMSTHPIDPMKFRDGSATVVLKRGLLLEGQVVDAKGTALLDGTVSLAQPQDNQAQLPPQKIDDDGKFAYAFNAGDPVSLSVSSPGFVIEHRDLVMGSADQQMKIQLTPGRKFEGQIVDPSGKAVANAYIYNISWGGHEAEATVRSDAEGHFLWDEAPPVAFTYSVEANGFKQLDNQTAPVTDGPVTIKMKAGLRVHGTVVDAETGKPIENFQVIQGIRWDDNNPINWQRGMQNGKPMPGGKFDFSINYQYPAYEVRIEADGHYAVNSRVFKSSEDDVQLDLKMKPGKDVVATVLDAQGKPVAGAKSVMAIAENMAYIRSGTEVQEGIVSPASDANGMIHFPPQDGDYQIAVLADEGYAKVDQDALAASPKITLQPWGRVEGVLMIGNQLGAGLDITLSNSGNNYYAYNMRAASIYSSWSAKTDGTGHFVFERVEPGTVSIERLIRMGRYNQGSDRVGWVDVKPGETVKVAVGGTGRPVTGKVTVPETLAKKGDWGFGYSTASSDTKGYFEPPMPDNVRAGTEDDKKKWYAEFIKSKPGKAYLKVMNDLQMKRHEYPIVMNKDGTFRIDDVVPGHYQGQVSIVRNMRNGGEQYIGSAQLQFTVSQMDGGRSDEPQVVGDVKATLNPGE